jgi:N-acetylglucosaminyldiphosphoundecaprenol N-acetyl-beta-D-mannosaminyltransferase
MRKYILGVPLDDFSLAEVSAKVLKGERVFQVFVNVHKINLFHRDKNLQNLILAKECIFSVDGKWVKWLANAKRFFPKKRFGGLDVIDVFFNMAEGNPFNIYLLGAKLEIISKAANILKEKFPKAKIVGFKDGYFRNEEEVIAEIKDKKPDILFLALPSPQKEVLGYRIFKEAETLRYVAGVGGAFDVIAGSLQRAPGWIQNMGLEWLYRCIQDPRRLFKRYFLDGFNFLILLFKDMFLKEGKNR